MTWPRIHAGSTNTKPTSKTPAAPPSEQPSDGVGPPSHLPLGFKRAPTRPSGLGGFVGILHELGRDQVVEVFRDIRPDITETAGEPSS